RGEGRHVERLTDLALIDVEGTDDLDVTRPVASDLVVHQTDVLRRRGLVGSAIELEALPEAAGTVAEARNGNRDLAHRVRSMRGSAPHILDEGRPVNR